MKLPELEELYRRYRMDLYRYLCFLTHDPVQAEDLLSETFVRVIKRLPTFRGECEVKTWLFGIARNIWLESLRRRHQSVSLDDLMERYITDDALTETTAARQKLRRVQALLQQKDERTRSVVYLRAQGYSYQEIAQKLQITEASARVVEHRTRAWLKATLKRRDTTNDARKRNKPASRTGKSRNRNSLRGLPGFDPAGAGWRCQPGK